MNVLIILNKKAGTKNSAEKETENDIKDVFSELSIKFDFLRVKGENIADTVRKMLSKNYDVICAAGGDGTISTVAGSLSGTDIPLGVIPLGTLNHFAKDLNIPLDLKEAVKVISKNKIIKIDIGEVNGKKFINNSSIGLYPKMVKKREKSEKLGGSKWTAMGLAFANIFNRFPLMKVIVRSNEKSLNCKTPYVFIGNNEYSTDLFNVGSREKITEGILGLYFPNSTTRFSMFRFALHGLLNKLDQQKDFTIVITKELSIEIKKKKIDVAIDGEVIILTSPLKYKIHPFDLKVIVP